MLPSPGFVQGAKDGLYLEPCGLWSATSYVRKLHASYTDSADLLFEMALFAAEYPLPPCVGTDYGKKFKRRYRDFSTDSLHYVRHCKRQQNRKATFIRANHERKIRKI